MGQNITNFELIKLLCGKFLYYIYLGINVPKNQTRKKIELCQNDLIFTKIFELYHVTKCVDIHKRLQVSKCFNTFKLYTLKVLLSKNWFYFFFSYLLECKNSTIFNSLVFFLSALLLSNLIWLERKLSLLDWKLRQYAWQKNLF